MIETSKLEELLNSSEDKVLTIYLNTDSSVSDGGRTASQIWLKGALKDLKKKISRDDLPYFEKVEEKAQLIVEGTLFKEKSAIIFVGEVLKEVITLQVGVEKEVSFGKPSIGQIIWLLEEYRPYGVIFVDATKVEFLRIQLNRVEMIKSFDLGLETTDWRKQRLMPPSSPRDGITRGAMGGGDRVEAFVDRVEANTQRFYKETTSFFSQLKKNYNINEIVLGGSEIIQDRYLKLLSKNKEVMVVGRVAIPLYAPPKEVLDTSLAVFWEYEREREKKIVELLLERSATGNLAGVGLDSSLKTLKDGKADTVIISRQIKVSLRECKLCFNLEKDKSGPCSFCGSEVFARGSIKTFLPLLIRKHKIKLEILGGEASEVLMTYGGIGAFWRY